MADVRLGTGVLFFYRNHYEWNVRGNFLLDGRVEGRASVCILKPILNCFLPFCVVFFSFFNFLVYGITFTFERGKSARLLLGGKLPMQAPGQGTAYLRWVYFLLKLVDRHRPK